MACEAMISVLMATHNGEAFVKEAIESVISQRGVSMELLITDDGSTDATPAIVQGMAELDARIRVDVQSHAGMAAARNRCLGHARGSTVALLDQDDLWPAGKLARQLIRLEAMPKLAGVFGLTQMFGTVTRASAGAVKSEYTMLLSAGLLRRDTVEATGEFDARCGTADDLDFLLRMLEAGHRFELEPGLGVLHRRHRGQATADLAATRRDCVRALARSLERRRRQGSSGPLRHPLLAALG
jgi:glycosyltransferase involved in cell wall biosynthesis